MIHGKFCLHLQTLHYISSEIIIIIPLISRTCTFHHSLSLFLVIIYDWKKLLHSVCLRANQLIVLCRNNYLHVICFKFAQSVVQITFSNMSFSAMSIIETLLYGSFSWAINNSYYPTALRRVQITLKTSTNIMQYLYSRGPVRQVSCHWPIS